MKARLVERGASADQTREIPITQTEFLIGRGADCDLRLRVPSISRHHCMIRIEHDAATLSDLGSSNGTYLNEQRIRSQAPLHTGDEIRLDEYFFVVDLGDEEGVDMRLSGEKDAGAPTIKLRGAAAVNQPAEVIQPHTVQGGDQAN